MIVGPNIYISQISEKKIMAVTHSCSVPCLFCTDQQIVKLQNGYTHQIFIFTMIVAKHFVHLD